jgi:hypothetical protein
MKAEGVEDPVRWTIDQIKTRLPAMVTEAGYEKIAKLIDQETIARKVVQVETDILARAIKTTG